MKKLIILAAAFSMMSYGDASAQNFLNKMKQKAEEAVNNQINRVTGNGSSSSQTQKIDITDSPSGDNTQVTTQIVTDFEYEQKGSSSNTFGVDLDNVAPASGNTYEQLLAQLPVLPTAAQIANPTESEYQTYFKKLTAVQLKVEQLEEVACEVAIPEFQQPQIPTQTNANPMAGLSKEEIQLLMREGEKIESEIEAYEKKQGRKLSDIEKFVYMRQNHNNLLKVMLKMNENTNGISAVEMEKLVADIEAEQKTKGRSLTEAEMNDIAQKKYPNLYNKAMAAKNKADQAQQAINQRNSEANALRDKQRKLEELDKKTYRDKDEAAQECYQFAAQYESQLRDIYQKIIKTSDRTQINQLYAKADEMVKSYKQNASKSWINGISNHIELVKSTLPERIKLYNTTDECTIQQIKIRELEQIIQDMESAYGEFPLIGVEPVQVSKTNIKCYAAESVFYPKVTGFMENSRLSKEGEDFTGKYTCGKEKPAYGNYKSQDGKRTVVFAQDGSLTLPGGYTHYPIAFEQQGDTLVWYEISGTTVMEYKYKL